MSNAETVVRILVRLFQTFPTGIWLVLEEDDVASWSGDYELRKLQVSWSRIPSTGVAQDAAMCTFHFLNLTGGNPDDTWTAADYGAVETAFDTFWGALGTSYSAESILKEYLWRKDGPSFRPHGTELSPTERITARNVPGSISAGAELPPQCACSVTEVIPATFLAHGVGVPGSAPGTGRTQLRNRWGRFYLPAPQTNQIAAGRFTSAFCTKVGDAAKVFYDACVSAQLIPVVYSPTTGNAWSVDAIHVDDIVDVIRSRRFVTPLTRTPRTITPV